MSVVGALNSPSLNSLKIPDKEQLGPFLKKLPNEIILLHIFTSCTVPDLGRISRVNKYCYFFVHDSENAEFLWKFRFLTDFPLCSLQPFPAKMTWKIAYRNKYSLKHVHIQRDKETGLFLINFIHDLSIKIGVRKNQVNSLLINDKQVRFFSKNEKMPAFIRGMIFDHQKEEAPQKEALSYHLTLIIEKIAPQHLCHLNYQIHFLPDEDIYFVKEREASYLILTIPPEMHQRINSFKSIPLFNLTKKEIVFSAYKCQTRGFKISFKPIIKINDKRMEIEKERKLEEGDRIIITNDKSNCFLLTVYSDLEDGHLNEQAKWRVKLDKTAQCYKAKFLTKNV